MILDNIVASTIKRVEKCKEKVSFESVYKSAIEMENSNEFRFKKALEKKELSFICEVKKGSPSKGIISEEFPYIEIAEKYESIGADAVSVLTEPDFFKGDSSYLKEISEHISTPILRKDFIIDEYQIYEAKLLGASAVLLICSILSEKQLKAYLKTAHSLGLSALVEVHNEKEVEAALKTDAEVIGVNNRDLKVFTMSFDTSRRLSELIPDEKIFVSESGIKTSEDIQIVREIGADAVLIGEAFMKSENTAELMKSLRNI